MTAVYALLVGVDTYLAAGVPALRGCRNDVVAAAAFLRSRMVPETTLRLRELHNEAATRAAVIEGIWRHLRQAGQGDTALFWFCGHGSEMPVPRRFRHIESGPLMQTLVCADSRTPGVPDLLDKELSVLLDEVAERGAHVAVVLDSCHSAGATRLDLESRAPDVGVRWVPGVPASEVPEVLLPELGGRPASAVGRSDVEHVALAAARRFEVAQERRLDHARRGLFSWSLLRALGRLGGSATYRQLLIAARADVELRATCQVPQLHPEHPGPADQPFLGGVVAPPGTGMLIRHARSGWELDAGSCHGLPAVPAGADVLRVAESGVQPPREARVVSVLTERSRVEPIGWSPDQERQYQVVLSRVPLPATPVAVGGRPGDDPAAAERVLAALRTAGPGGGPSPHVRFVDPDEAPELRVATRSRAARVEGPDGAAIGGEIAGDPQAVVRRLEHIARWRQIHALDNPMSRLAGLVTLDIVPAVPGRLPSEADAPLVAENGEIRLRYTREGSTWVPPKIFIRLHNRHTRRLFCVLLDLTSGYRVHAALFSGDFVDPGATAWARGGRTVRVELPKSQPPEPGRSVRDVLKLLVAEEQFGSAPFDLPPLGEARPARRGPMALHGLLDRLGRIIVDRDDEVDGAGGYDWSALTLPVVTEVPSRR